MSRTDQESRLFAELAQLRAQLAASQGELASLRAAVSRRAEGAMAEQPQAAVSRGQGVPAAEGWDDAATDPAGQSALLRLILDSVGEGVAVVDARGQFVLFNRLGQEIVGLGPVTAPPEEWPVRYGLYLPDQVTFYPFHELPLVKAMRGEPVREAEMFVRNERRPEGLWLRITATPLRDANGQICGGVAVFRDVTLATQTQQALEAERRALKHMVQAQERDRRLTAYEIHDGFVQQVVAALMQLEAAGLASEANDSRRQQLQLAITLLRSAIEEARRLINGLRPPLLDELGLMAAVEHLVGSLAQPGGPRIELEHQVHFDRLDPLLEGTIFRMVQEALNNALRHSGSERLAVRLVQHDNHLRIEIIDWGRGFDAAKIPADRFGLRGLMERARLFGGSMRLEAAPGQGTCVQIEVPLAAWSMPSTEGAAHREDMP